MSVGLCAQSLLPFFPPLLSFSARRFIPSRDGADLSAQYQLMDDPPTPGRQKRKAPPRPDMDNLKGENLSKDPAFSFRFIDRFGTGI